MDISVYDANGRPKLRAEIPKSSGQFVDNGISVYTNTNVTPTLAAAAYSSDMVTPLTLVGDGINGMILEFTSFGTFISSGTSSHYTIGIYDTTIGAAGQIGAAQHWDTVGSNESGDACVRAYVPPFLGTKTFRVAVVAGASQAITNQASTDKPSIFTAQWATPTSITGIGSAPAIQWFSPAYNSGWSDYAAPYGPVKYGKTADGTVFIKGTAVSTGASGTAFTLPAGFRPSQTLIFRCDNNSSWVRYDVDANGNVFQATAAIAAPYISFSGITFMAEQ